MQHTDETQLFKKLLCTLSSLVLLFAQTYQTIFEKLDSYSEYVYDYLRPIFVPLRLTLAEYLASSMLIK